MREIRRSNFQSNRPAGQWRILEPVFEVAGIMHYKSEAQSFIKGSAQSADRSLPCGLEPQREPSNPNDRNAIAIYGLWTQQRLIFGNQERRVKIGYVPKDRAALIAADVPVVLQLYSVFLGAQGFVAVEALLLLPGVKSGFWQNRTDKHPFR